MTKHILIFDDIPLHRRVKAARVARGWTQTDLATYATEALRAYYEDDIIRITPQHVSFLENNLGSRPDRTQAILKVLGMEDEKDV
tara:strand:+ start:329 stop:583 length:255 start_codon:yes stop_codon:yes gene_type:complete